MALGSTQPVTEMSTRNLPEGVKGCRRVGQISPPSLSGLSRNCESLDVSQLWASTTCYRDRFEQISWTSPSRVSLYLAACFCRIYAWSTLLHWNWSWWIPPKRRAVSELHGFKSQTIVPSTIYEKSSHQCPYRKGLGCAQVPRNAAGLPSGVLWPN
jgi:hypothetical protein